jgi:polyhydroxyalkanoate synthase
LRTISRSRARQCNAARRWIFPTSLRRPSGHVAGVINPPAKNKRSHWKNEGAVDAQTWFDSAEEHPGSWWPDWDAWLKRHGSGTIPAPKIGGGKYKPIEPAPGRYVKEKSN